MIICQGSLNMLVLRPGWLSYLIQAGLPVFRVDLQIVKCYRYYHMVQESWANNECGFNCLCMKGSRNFYAQISMLKELYYFYNNFSEASAAEGCRFNPTRVHS